MLFNAVARLTPTRLRFVGAFIALLLLGLPCSRGSAANAVPWHADLPAAQRASQISGRPVLAIFTASWMATAAAVDRTSLASDEAVALVTACYEPVCVDVDAHPEATRRAGVTRVPMACVLTADGQMLAKFELPETPAEFVAAAARAAQDAAFATAASQSSPRGVVVEQAVSGRTLTRMASSDSAFGGSETRTVTSGQTRGLVPPGGRAITAVAAKVRMLSDFASTDCPATPESDAIAASFREAAVQETDAASPQQHAAASPTPAPGPIPTPSSALASTPAATAPTATAAGEPTTTAAAQAVEAALAAPSTAPSVESFAGSAPQSPLGVDPASAAPTTAAAGAAPWLGLPQAAPSIAPPSQPSAATVAATPSPARVIEPQTEAAEKPAEPVAAQAQASPPAAKPASAASSLMATLQKPFAMFARPTAPSQTEPQDAAPATQDSVATAPPSEPDPYGSMPVGLEGYCPVMLAERGVWVEGRAQWGARHRGRTYLFAGEQQQKAFLADPDRYAPALSGDDPVLAFDSGKCTPGQRRYGVTYQSRMYLFSSPATRDAFAANPQRYTAGAFVAENRSNIRADGSVVR